jgi:hypothetical protein
LHSTSKALAIRALSSGYFSQLLRPSTLPSTSTLIASKSSFAVKFVGLLCSSAFVFPRLACLKTLHTVHAHFNHISHQLRVHRTRSLPLPVTFTLDFAFHQVYRTDQKPPQKRQFSLPTTIDSTNEPPTPTLTQRVAAMTTHKVQIKNEEEDNYNNTAMFTAAQSPRARTPRFGELMGGFEAASRIKSKGTSGVGPSGGRRSDSSPTSSSASVSHSSASGVGDLRTLSGLEKEVKETVTTFCKDLELREDVTKFLAGGCYRIIMDGGPGMKEELEAKVNEDFKVLDLDKSLAKVLLTYLDKVVGNVAGKVVDKRYVVLAVKFVGLPDGSADYEEEI